MLHDHIIDGFEVTHRGLKQLGHVTEEEYILLLEKNIHRLVTRIREFRITEKLLSVFFAILFLSMQINGDDLEARRSSRTRTRTGSSRSWRLRSAKGGRKDIELVA